MPTPEAWLENLDHLHRIANGMPDLAIVNDPDESEELGAVEAEDRFQELDAVFTNIANEVLRLLEESPQELKVPLLKFIFGLFVVGAIEHTDDK
jgi:hypothetical protein